MIADGYYRVSGLPAAYPVFWRVVRHGAWGLSYYGEPGEETWDYRTYGDSPAKLIATFPDATWTSDHDRRAEMTADGPPVLDAPPRSAVRPRERWYLLSEPEGSDDLDEYLADGWEPFGVTREEREVREIVEACPYGPAYTTTHTDVVTVYHLRRRAP